MRGRAEGGVGEGRKHRGKGLGIEGCGRKGREGRICRGLRERGGGEEKECSRGDSGYGEVLGKRRGEESAEMLGM